MSVQALSWVFDHSTAQGTDRLVLLSLANHAGGALVDGAWESWPGVDLIQREAGLDRRRTVQDALARLVKAGLIERRLNQAPDSRIPADRRPNLYRIGTGVSPNVTPADPDGVTPERRRGDAPTYDGVTRGDATGCRETSPKPSVEPSEEPSRTEPRAKREIARVVSEGFDFFWSVYPRRVAKGAARKAWDSAIVRAGGIQPVLDGARRYAAERSGEDPRYTAHPATWLVRDQWKDEAAHRGPSVSKSTKSLAAWAARNDQEAIG